MGPALLWARLTEGSGLLPDSVSCGTTHGDPSQQTCYVSMKLVIIVLIGEVSFCERTIMAFIVHADKLFCP